MTDKFIIKYNNSLWALIVYCIALVVLIGLTYERGIVDAMVLFVTLYRLPLSVFLILYIVLIASAIYKRFRLERPLPKVLFSVTMKIGLATLPMLFLDNRMATILDYLNHR